MEMSDSVLAIAITKKIVQTLRHLAACGRVSAAGKRQGIYVWRLSPSAT
jgi:hypothetical protein